MRPYLNWTTPTSIWWHHPLDQTTARWRVQGGGAGRGYWWRALRSPGRHFINSKTMSPPPRCINSSQPDIKFIVFATTFWYLLLRIGTCYCCRLSLAMTDWHLIRLIGNCYYELAIATTDTTTRDTVDLYLLLWAGNCYCGLVIGIWYSVLDAVD